MTRYCIIGKSRSKCHWKAQNSHPAGEPYLGERCLGRVVEHLGHPNESCDAPAVKLLIESSSCCLNIVPFPSKMFHFFRGGVGNAKLATDESLAKCKHVMLWSLIVGKWWETWVELSGVLVGVRGSQVDKHGFLWRHCVACENSRFWRYKV